MYLASRRKKAQHSSGKDGTREKRTPEQTDNANEYEPEVRGNNGEVDDLSGYVHDPEITKRRYEDVKESPRQPQRTNYAVTSERMPIRRKGRYGGIRAVSDQSGGGAAKHCWRTWLILFPASPNPFPSNTLIHPKKYATATGLKID